MMAANTTNDMTSGSPVRLILQFMIPVCLGNIFQQFYNVADSIVAGQFIGVDALAAIGSTGSLMFFVTGWLNGLSSGFAILVSQWFGAKRYDHMRHYVAMSVYLAAAFAIVMTAGFLVLNEPILRLMNFSDEIMPDVMAYMEIIYAGLIVTAAYNSLAAFLRALGDSRSPLYFLIISALINVVLDIAFIVCFGMGVEGCAYATVIAQGISALLCVIYILKKYPIQCLRGSLYGRIFGSGETPEYHCYRFYRFRSNDRHICGTEPGRRKDGQGEDRSEVYSDHDPCVECGHYGDRLLLWGIHDASVRQPL